ncbi:MAG: protein-L-isoaspartate(D-aspartate) O-methyltransferase [Verrucomicrobia bacterium]|nr:protein-L-isoaspartate(D-aspartate) O-methyltransferase [Verrucomicrobiota bacterium]MBU4247478.1 protein-L-isoaspartate(D-aspartate) O-methyltransferase [Verrucomicrobiota bacterium]MBU4292309.1 protein-L-isoaspartate(D-aspartate) O-methyltransferase [Verrucomicrobiota bacterium]MBU4430409.1 protein-L-isoaspartate(D-aspartate) O-methyltransferase [Verrucomicrobiota bacterium]MBU4497077.1 protein-L-isoaspartate(D-aspartate) O-methyltransferase [Verrucomicrobiota bacterium]
MASVFNVRSESSADTRWLAGRQAMVKQLRAYRIADERILKAMGKVRRHQFIPDSFRDRGDAYGDHPCPIGYDQTISQPYIVAYMTERLNLKPGEKVLEVGTGSGYQAAILAECGAEVYSIEIIPELARHARTVLDAEGYIGVHILTGDGYKGWPEYKPFDAIIVTCAPDEVPENLVAQLKEGGRMIVPVGTRSQRLVILRKRDGKVETEEDLPVRFVPMIHDRTNAPPAP